MAHDDQHHVGAFLEMLAAEEGAAVNTLDAYRRDLTDYCEFIASEGAGVLGAGKAHVARYAQALATQGLKASSRARRLSSLRQLYKFLEAEGLVRESPVTGMQAPGRCGRCRKRCRLPRWTGSSRRRRGQPTG